MPVGGQRIDLVTLPRDLSWNWLWRWGVEVQLHCFFKLGARCRWAVNASTWSLYPGIRLGTGSEDGEYRYSSTVSLNLVLDAGGRSTHRPGHFTPGMRPGVDCTAGWVSPEASLNGYEKSRPTRILSPDHQSHTQYWGHIDLYCSITTDNYYSYNRTFHGQFIIGLLHFFFC